MQTNLFKKVYTAGPITGLSYGESTDWRNWVKEQLEPYGIAAYSPMRGKGYLAGEMELKHDYQGTALSGEKAITYRDRWDVMTSDLVLFNFLGANIVSIGTCIELGWADAFRKPSVLLMEESNIHEHPIVRQICGWRANTLGDGLEIIKHILIG